MSAKMSIERGAIRFEGVSFAYPNGPAILKNLSLSVAPGEFVALVGPSGSGKTTLLGLLSGYLSPSDGNISRGGATRTVYQSDGLFPWLSVRKNVALGVRHLAKSERDARVDAMLALVGLSDGDVAARYPRQLSGGMRQRAEIARALVGDADILLLDEPFSALDYLTRLRMRAELARLIAERPRTVVLVTHDIEEAAQLADRVLVLSERPATVRAERRIVAPRPRALTDASVVDALQEILELLGVDA